MIAFEEKRVGELVIHAPPINILALFLIPFTILPSEGLGERITKKMCMYFSYMLFWGENIIFVTFFTIFEVLLIPLIYVICFINIVYSTKGLFTTVFNIIKWLSSGFIYLFCMLCNDVWNLIKILAKHRGCKQEIVIDEDEIKQKTSMTIECFNEIRKTAIEMYVKKKKQIDSERSGGKVKYED